MEKIISYVKMVLFFLLFVNLVMQLLKGSSYERFVRPICGMIFVILIVQPVLQLFGAEEKVLFAAEQKLSLFFAQEEIPYEEETGGYEFAVLKEYEKELIAGLTELLEKEGLFVVSAKFSLSAEEKDFGTIRGLSVTAETRKSQETKKIEIAPIVFSEERRENAMSAEEIRIKDKLADFYNLEEGNIYVNIKEEQDG